MAALPLADIQGLILRGYGMDALRLFVLRVDKAAEARAILGGLPVTSGAIWDKKPDFCLNVAFTHAGLAALQVPDASLSSFPPEFIDGAVNRAAIVGDTGANAPANWKASFTGTGVHVIVL